jgi:hypothetical protein
MKHVILFSILYSLLCCLKIFFLECPIWLPLFLLLSCAYVIASIPYMDPVYGAGVRTHNLLIMSRLP